ncbi:MAG: phosphoribosylformylglycinamidine synthase subunit PurS [Armatimonadota bacterium]|nr:phosphoribosylformylglycinamidine synthase subunit PurS [Armatimonadota bacterium]MDR7402282.1 phosphoribosylformylglycinamidine synthase subunit PurS [Armatimonadota bacterium]MDR7403801.1 phosphoribosylformylglycinamidine synthase subunit PurS [Armatimonadota bacterium]MDR7437630.1 phosphoribosylformylglycinamidine synthase subunit PurS [Armatimonadota bacterium]MDR7472606.1 phosphoribosylformylglycinamidine synthase subunit PurS [Armatimonadota bacterium]
MKVRVVVTLKPGVLDAQGQAVLSGLHTLGYRAVSQVRVGRYLELDLPDGTPRREVEAMCARFLANPLIERWWVEADHRGTIRPRRRAAIMRGGQRR